MATKRGRKAPMPPEGTVAYRVRQLRDRLGLSQEQLGERGGFGREEINNVEGGKNQASTQRWADGLAKVAGVSSAKVGPYLRGEIPLDEFLIADESAPHSEPVSMFDLMAWIHSSPAIFTVVGTKRDVTVQDLLRLRAHPAREAEANADQVYQHILQLRRGPIADVVAAQPVSAKAIESQILAALPGGKSK